MNRPIQSPFRARKLLIVMGTVCVVLAIIQIAFPRREASSDTLRLIGVSIDSFRDSQHEYPPRVVFDENGRPTHSWRVYILPFVEANAFTNEYDRTSGWDSPRNADLASGTRVHESDKFPRPADVRSVYYRDRIGRRDATEDLTTDILMVVTDKGWRTGDANAYQRAPINRSWTAHRPPSFEIMLVEVARSGIHWMKPMDLGVGVQGETLLDYHKMVDRILCSLIVTPSELKFLGREQTLARLHEMERDAK